MFLEHRLSESQCHETVVVTHHAPSLRSVPGFWFNDPLAAAFASELDGTILRLQPELWVHGGIGEYIDYSIGKTRVVSNAKGWRRDLEGGSLRRHEDFIPDLVVDLVGECRAAAAIPQSTAALLVHV